MKVKNVKRIFAIVAVILFAILAIIIPTIAMAKGIKASAAEIEEPPYESQDTSFVHYSGTLQTTINQTQIYAYSESGTNSGAIYFDIGQTTWANVKSIFVNYIAINKNKQYVYIQIRNGSKVIGYDNAQISRDPEYFIKLNKDKIEINFQGSYNENSTITNIIFNFKSYGKEEPNSWMQFFLVDITTTTTRKYYKSYLNDVIETTGEGQYNTGYAAGFVNGREHGYNDGEKDGYDKGYTQGYDKGAMEGLKNPIEYFLKPIDSFMNTKIFGTLAIGNIISILLFVMIALIFLKMFAGG